MRFLAWALTGLLLLGSVAVFRTWNTFMRTPLFADKGEFMLDVSPGASFPSIRHQIEGMGIKTDAFGWRAWVWARNAAKRLRIGEYRIQKQWSQYRMLEEILSGQPVLHKIVVKEGHNIWDIEASFREAYGEKGVAEFRRLIADPVRLEKMGVPTTKGVRRTLEGFLFPETYSYQKYDAPAQLVDAMLDQFNKRAMPLLEQHSWAQTPQGRYRLLTLASIVEKESGKADEQPLIASVFWNRIKKKMKLQSDPTTIYGLMPLFDGNLKRIHLTTPSAYNTYTLAELPAGPISNPGETAIQAVLHPTETDYFYFVGRGDGTHQFAADYATHNRNVGKFQLGKDYTSPVPVDGAKPVDKRTKSLAPSLVPGQGTLKGTNISETATKAGVKAKGALLGAKTGGAKALSDVKASGAKTNDALPTTGAAKKSLPDVNSVRSGPQGKKVKPVQGGVKTDVGAELQ